MSTTAPDSFALSHVATGEPFLRGFGEAPLRENPHLWKQLWEKFRDLILAEHLRRSPGSRPEAWYQFDRDPGDVQAEGEPEVEFLHRIGELPPGEIEAIRRCALELVRYNSCGRRPDKPSTNFVPPDSRARFAARVGLITAAERATLYIDDQGRNVGKRWDGQSR